MQEEEGPPRSSLLGSGARCSERAFPWFSVSAGVLIANTDRHYGNISLILRNDDWTLSPTYDMLPMLYAPIGGELVERDFAARPLQPTAATLPEWAQARTLAKTFWQAAASDKRVSEGFRVIASKNLSHIGL